MVKAALFNRGDVILTHPHEGYWGIAVVLSERERTPETLPLRHIAETLLIFEREVDLSKLDISDLVPLEFERYYTFELEKGRRKKEPYQIINSIQVANKLTIC